MTTDNLSEADKIVLRAAKVICKRMNSNGPSCMQDEEDYNDKPPCSPENCAPASIAAALSLAGLLAPAPLSGREEGLEEAAIAAESQILANVPVWADPTLINRTFNTMEETKKSIAATIRALKTSPATEVTLKPGWFARNIARASALAAEWEGKTPATGGRDAVLEEEEIAELIWKLDGPTYSAWPYTGERVDWCHRDQYEIERDRCFMLARALRSEQPAGRVGEE